MNENEVIDVEDKSEVKPIQAEDVLGSMAKWKQDKILKKAKKKSKKQLVKAGFGRREAAKAVNAGVIRIGGNKPAKKSAGRGR